MRHGKKFNHLGRKTAHRKALLRNLAIALITHKRIQTTLAKAKALRKYIEPLATKSKSNTMHNRRVVFSYLQNKQAIEELFGVIAPKIMDRPGGYVRVIKTGFRRSDAAEMALIEFVDFNDVYKVNDAESDTGSSRRRRRRRGKGKNTNEAANVIAAEDTDTTEEILESEGIEDAEVEEVVDEATVENTEEENTAEENNDSGDEKSEEDKKVDE